MTNLWRLLRKVKLGSTDDSFLFWIKRTENLVSKLLSIAMIIVLLAVVMDLFIFLARTLAQPPYGLISETLTDVFGMFLSALIALEILENITAYLKHHVVQVELVIATSLTAVARKIIILDLKSISGATLIGLAIAIFSLAISYLIVRSIHNRAEGA